MPEHFGATLESWGKKRSPKALPLVSREWRNGSNSNYNCTPFLHSLLTKGKKLLQSCAKETAWDPSSSPGCHLPVGSVLNYLAVPQDARRNKISFCSIFVRLVQHCYNVTISVYAMPEV